MRSASPTCGSPRRRACFPATPRRALLHHGVKANRKVIETIAQYSLEQGLTPRLIKIEELYAPSALDT